MSSGGTSKEGDKVGAQFLFVVAAHAYMSGDMEEFEAAVKFSSPYDFQVAVTMYISAIEVLSERIGATPLQLMAALRGQLVQNLTTG